MHSFLLPFEVILCMLSGPSQPGMYSEEYGNESIGLLVIKWPVLFCRVSMTLCGLSAGVWLSKVVLQSLRSSLLVTSGNEQTKVSLPCPSVQQPKLGNFSQWDTYHLCKVFERSC